jgi:hypothetical protein
LLGNFDAGSFHDDLPTPPTKIVIPWQCFFQKNFIFIINNKSTKRILINVTNYSA